MGAASRETRHGCPMTERLGLASPPGLADHLRTFGPMPLPGGRSGGQPGPLVDEVERAGLRGRGGGWFPTHLKLRAVVESSESRGRLSRTRQPLVIANGMEGEPASSKDVVLLTSSPHLVLDGIEAAARTIGATDAFIAVHRGSPAVEVLERAIAERPASGLPITLVTPPARYVASEESALSHWVGDGVAQPVYPDRPFQKGAGGRPTLVQNVETLAHLALIARYGGAWFAEVGAPSAPGTTLVSLGGALGHMGVVEVPTGTPVKDLLGRAGGTTSPVRGFLTGGYGGGWVAADGFMSTPWDPDSVRAAGGVIGASILWAVGAEVCPLEELDRITRWMAGESAGQCGPCIFGLPALADDVHSLASRRSDATRDVRLQRHLTLVTGRGGCKHPDGVARLVATALSAFPDEVAIHGDGRCSAHPGAGTHLPVPPVRVPVIDPSGRDFR